MTQTLMHWVIFGTTDTHTHRCTSLEDWVGKTPERNCKPDCDWRKLIWMNISCVGSSGKEWNKGLERSASV